MRQILVSKEFYRRIILGIGQMGRACWYFAGDCIRFLFGSFFARILLQRQDGLGGGLLWEQGT